MGTTASAPATGNFKPVAPIDCFRTSILLVGAPQSLHGVDLSETDWRVLRSVTVTVVRWDGGQLTSERLARVIGTQSRHLAVFYFFNEQDTSATDATRRIHSLLPQAITASPESRICAIETTPYIDANDPSRAIDFESVVKLFAQSPNISTQARDRIEYHRVTSSAKLLSLVTPPLLKSMPKEVTRPLNNLASDLLDATGALEFYLFDTQSLLPVMATGVNRMEDNFEDVEYLTARASALSDALRNGLQSLLYTEETTLRFFCIETAEGGVYVGPLAAPLCVAVVFVPEETGAGEGLVRHNFAHYSEHFANVLGNTSKSKRFTPIFPPEKFENP